MSKIMKTCATCKRSLSIECFTRDASRTDGLQVRCRSCNDEKCRVYRYRTEYGITIEEYEQLFIEQNGLCAICKTEPLKYKLAVDHDHDTGAVRGLLCSRCNRAIEWYLYYKDIASEYLEKNK